jgi:hypothetical protein
MAAATCHASRPATNDLSPIVYERESGAASRPAPRGYRGRERRTEITLEPIKFPRGLVALIPPPYANLVRYHGVLANRSKFRPSLPTPPPCANPDDASFDTPAHGTAHEGISPSQVGTAASTRPEGPMAIPPHRHIAWAQLLRRVLDIDALACARCSSPMVVLAFLTDTTVVRKILQHIGLPPDPPTVTPARCPRDEQPSFEDTTSSNPGPVNHNRTTPLALWRAARSPP